MNPLVYSATNNMYSISKKITEKFTIKSFKDNKCFIVGGGSSLKGVNLEKIFKYKTIGVNRSFEFFNTDLLYCMDYDFYDNIIEERCSKGTKEKFKKFNGTKIFLALDSDKLRYSDDVYVVNRIYADDKRINISNLDDGIYAGSNSGFGALMLAITLGSTEIYLLGFDMKVNSSLHFHNGYFKQDVGAYLERMKEWKNEFNEWAYKFTMLGITIKNCYINSETETDLNCFQKVNFSTIA